MAKKTPPPEAPGYHPPIPKTLRTRLKEAGAPPLLVDYLLDNYDVREPKDPRYFQTMVETLKAAGKRNLANYPQHFLPPTGTTVKFQSPGNYEGSPLSVGSYSPSKDRTALYTSIRRDPLQMAQTLAHEGSHMAHARKGKDFPFYDQPYGHRGYRGKEQYNRARRELRDRAKELPEGTPIGHSDSYTELQADLTGMDALSALGKRIWENEHYAPYFQHPDARQTFIENAYPWMPKARAAEEDDFPYYEDAETASRSLIERLLKRFGF